MPMTTRPRPRATAGDPDASRARGRRRAAPISVLAASVLLVTGCTAGSDDLPEPTSRPEQTTIAVVPRVESPLTYWRRHPDQAPAQFVPPNVTVLDAQGVGSATLELPASAAGMSALTLVISCTPDSPYELEVRGAVATKKRLMWTASACGPLPGALATSRRLTTTDRPRTLRVTVRPGVRYAVAVVGSPRASGG